MDETYLVILGTREATGERELLKSLTWDEVMVSSTPFSTILQEARNTYMQYKDLKLALIVEGVE